MSLREELLAHPDSLLDVKANPAYVYENEDGSEQLFRGPKSDASVNTYGRTATEIDQPRDEVGSDMFASVSDVQPSSFFKAVFNIMNAIMGSGLLGLAFALKSSGMIPFFVLILCTCFLAMYTVTVMIKLSEAIGARTYEALGFAAFGKRGETVTSICCIIQNYGAMTSYCVIMADVLPEVMLHWGVSADSVLTKKWFLVIGLAMLVIFPLALLRDVRLLGYSSGLSILMMTIFSVVVLYKKADDYRPTAHPHSVNPSVMSTQASDSWDSLLWGAALSDSNKVIHRTVKYFVWDSDTFYVLPTLCFAFVCHTTILPVYAEMKRTPALRMQKISYLSGFASLVMYATVAVFSYLTFYNTCKADILKNYGSNDRLLNWVKFFFAVSILLTIPLIHYPCRKSLNLLLTGHAQVALGRHIVTTFFNVALVTTLALTVPSIKQVFGLVGSSSGVMLVFILPGLFAIRLSQQSPWSKPNCMNTFCVILGAVVGIVSTVGIVSGWISGDGSD